MLIRPEIPVGELDPVEVHDGDVEQIAAISPTANHREVDIMCVRLRAYVLERLGLTTYCPSCARSVADAFKRGKFLGYIILPSTIFGRGDGPINKTSIQVGLACATRTFRISARRRLTSSHSALCRSRRRSGTRSSTSARPTSSPAVRRSALLLARAAER